MARWMPACAGMTWGAGMTTGGTAHHVVPAHAGTQVWAMLRQPRRGTHRYGGGGHQAAFQRAGDTL